MPPALKRMETGLSSNATPVLPSFRFALSAFWPALTLGLSSAVAAQETASPPPAPAATPAPAPAAPPTQRIDLSVTVPKGEPNQAELRACNADEEAAAINGEIVVCRVVGTDTSALTGTRAESQKRYAQETANKGKPAAPDLFGIPDNGKGIGFGKAPPPAITVDFDALPKAPAGSDADRIARGLAPLGQEEELSEEQERARREAAGIRTTVPPRPTKRKKGG